MPSACAPYRLAAGPGSLASSPSKAVHAHESLPAVGGPRASRRALLSGSRQSDRRGRETSTPCTWRIVPSVRFELTQHAV